MRRRKREIEIALWSDSDSEHLCENICMKNMFEKMATNYLAKHKNCERERKKMWFWCKKNAERERDVYVRDGWINFKLFLLPVFFLMTLIP